MKMAVQETTKGLQVYEGRIPEEILSNFELVKVYNANITVTSKHIRDHIKGTVNPPTALDDAHSRWLRNQALDEALKQIVGTATADSGVELIANFNVIREQARYKQRDVRAYVGILELRVEAIGYKRKDAQAK